MKNNRIPLLLVSMLLCPAACEKKPAAQPPVVPPAPGELTITSEPAGAAVYVGRRTRLGNTPLTITRPDGALLNLTMVKDGYDNVALTVMFEGGKKKKEHRRFLVATGILLVDAGLVKGAEIFVDGVQLGKTPERVKVAAGRELLVEVKEDNFHPYRERITVKPGLTRKVMAQLVPVHLMKVPGGWLTVTCDPPSRIMINGKDMGETPLERVPLPARSHTVRLVSEDLALSSDRSVTVKASELTSLHVKLKEEADR